MENFKYFLKLAKAQRNKKYTEQVMSKSQAVNTTFIPKCAQASLPW